MKIVLIVSNFFLFSLSAMACMVDWPKHLIVLSKDINTLSFVKDCPENVTTELKSLLGNSRGTLPTKQFQTMLKSGDAMVFTGAPVVTIHQLEDLIKEKYAQAKDSQLEFEVKANHELITSSDPLAVEVSCYPCQFTQKESIAIVTKNLMGIENRIEIQTQTTKMIEGYEVTAIIPAFSEKIPSQELKKTLTKSNVYSRPFQAIAQLRFYKTNKTLRSGDILQLNDLTPLSLIRAGEQTEIIFESGNLSVRAQGIARQAGGISDSVEIYNPKNQKKYLGKVIDFKKVIVEL